MTVSPLLRAAGYLFLSLFAMILGGFFSPPYAELIHLLFILAAFGIDSRFQKCSFRSKAASKDRWLALLLFPVFFALTLGANLLFAKITLLLGGDVPTVTPSLPLFLGAVLLAPVAEELLFRHLLLSLFSPYGKRKAVLLSALLFALAHGNFFQMPYAFVAGCLLGMAAMMGGSVLFPIAFHLLYNLAAFFSNEKANILLLILFTLLSLPILCLLAVRLRTAREESQRISVKDAAFLYLYGGVMLLFSVFRLL